MPWITQNDWDRLNERLCDLERGQRIYLGDSKSEYSTCEIVLKFLIEKIGLKIVVTPEQKASFDIVRKAQEEITTPPGNKSAKKK